VRQTAIPIGGFAAATVIPVIAELSGPRAALAALAGFSFVCAIAAAAVLREGPVETDDDTSELLRHPLRDRRIWQLSIASSVLVCTQLALLSFMVVFLQDFRGFSTAEAGAVLAVTNGIAAVGRLGLGWLSDRLGRRVGLIQVNAVLTAIAVGVAAASVDATTWLLIPALILGSALAMSWNGLSFTAAAEAAGRARSGAATGLQQTALAVAGALTPIVFAPFVEATSWQAGFAAAAFVPLVAFAILRPLGR
jgi:predicted MFS family arabinose efflux permease